MMPDDALDPAVNSSQDEQTDEPAIPWDCDATFPDEVEDDDE